MNIKPELYDIAGQVIFSGDTTAVTPLPDDDITTLHYAVTQFIKDKGEMTERLKQHIYKYVSVLTRYHRGLFWVIFNRLCKSLSETWYLCCRKHINIILYSLACTAPKVSLEYWAQVQCLDSVVDYHVQPSAVQA